MRILAIETSCDDTGVAILESLSGQQPRLLANLVSSQVKVHAPWGGVVPSLAKREHQRNLPPLLIKALSESKLLKISKSQIPISKKIQKSKLRNLEKILEREPELTKQLVPFLKKYSKPNIDYVAVTAGPGLEPALWTGVNLARALSFFWRLPIIPVNHLQGHISAALTEIKLDKNYFPAVCLVVSGGHTQLVLIEEKKAGTALSEGRRPAQRDKVGVGARERKAVPVFDYKIIGETRDDAAGEAFDKVAKMLGLGYPGGPIISRLASQSLNHSITQSLSLPRPMLHSGDFDFSFSGLKTAVLYALQKMTPAQIKQQAPAITAEFQQAVIDVLTAKTLAAARKNNAKTIILAGGVAANAALRQNLKAKSAELKINFLSPPLELCADNAVMIALAALQKNAKKTAWQALKAEANLRIL